jgi:sulfide:quinone oxidoreductase
VTSIYSPKYVEKVINNAKELKKGNALFNVAQMPIKCGGAPHKICYLLEDLWRK